MSYKIGIFSKYKRRKKIFHSYHNSSCKIYKILDELKNIIQFEYKINDYKDKYDFVIFDRIKPAKKIDSKYILNFTEENPKTTWATHSCTTTLGVKASGSKHFYLLNYCQGKKLVPNQLAKKNQKAVFLGRITGEIEQKIIIISKYMHIDIFPIKYWHENRILRFGPGAPDGKDNLKFLQKRFGALGAKKLKVKAPKNHSVLYKALNKNGYNIGFVPSVYSLSSRRKQKESSSKFFEYIGAGIPVLIESTVPEAALVLKNPFLGKVYSGKSDMIKKAGMMLNRPHDCVKVLNYANKKHFPDSRARILYSKFIKHGI